MVDVALSGPQLRRIDAVATRGELIHDRSALLVAEPAPAADLLQGAETAQTQACRTVDDADLHTGRGDRAGRTGAWRRSDG